jgi:hypothetical protein
MGDPIQDDYVPVAEVRPMLLGESGDNIGANPVVVLCRGNAVSFNRGECLDENRPADDPDELAVLQNRHAFDPMLLKQRCNLSERSILGRGNHFA